MDDFPQQIHNRGYIPHIDGADYQFITYRLFDSLPNKVMDDIVSFGEQQRNQWINRYLDNGFGCCLLREKQFAKIVVDNWFFHHAKKYELIAFVVMPNHVHVLIKVIPGQQLAKIVHSWKSFTAKAIIKVIKMGERPSNPVNGFCVNQVWQADYFDRYIRDENHFNKVIRYIHENPVKAGLVAKIDQWQWSSAYRC